MNKTHSANSIARRYYYSFAKLARYKPPFIANAEAAISKLLGTDTLKTLVRNSFAVQKEFIKVSRQGEVSRVRIDRLLPYLKPSDYYIPLPVYAGIHTAISFEYGFKGLKGKTILEIGANWGPYMHYLRHEHVANTYGVDTNKTAIEYAKNGGLDFFCVDANRMDLFRNNMFDLVISRNFFDLAYRYLFSNEEATSCMEKILKEIHRVLRPGGNFFSHDDYAETPLPTGIFRKSHRLETPSYQPVIILQK